MDLTANGVMTDADNATGYWTRYEHLKYNDVMKNVLIEVGSTPDSILKRGI